MSGEIRTSFAITLEGAANTALPCKPEEVTFQAQLLSPAGNILQSTPVKEGNFSFNLPPEEFKGKRIVLTPFNPKHSSDETTAGNALKVNSVRINPTGESNAYQPVLPETLMEYNQLSPVPVSVWRYWCYCQCRVRGRVFNKCGNTYSPVYYAKVHICEVERIWRWLIRLPDPVILQIRDSILNPAVMRENPQIPPVGPGPVERSGDPMISPEKIQVIRDTLQSRMNVISGKAILNNEATLSTLSSGILSQQSSAPLYSDSAGLVRKYLMENFRLFYPWWCYWVPIFWWWWYVCIDEIVVYTNEEGWFDTSIFHNCFDDTPDLYFWVEYNINGLWATVYNPSIYCNTYWDYQCGSEADIYMNAEGIPCQVNPAIPGKVVVVSTLGNNANVNRIQQSIGANQGLAPDILYPYNTHGPFGGSIEPHVIFGEALISSGVIYYRWSFKLNSAPDSTWAALTTSVYRHYFHINPDNSISFPAYPLGPVVNLKNNNLFQIQPSENPVTHDPWAILDARADTASAYFQSNQLNNGNVGLSAGLYDLKLELFDALGNLINLTDNGIGLLVPDPGLPAPFGNATVNTVTAPSDNRILDSNGKLVGFKLLIRVDNNPTYAKINETQVDGNSAGPCGFLVYNDLGTSQTIISYTASHPNGFAWYGFEIVKGSSGAVDTEGGMVPTVNPKVETIPVKTLLGNCVQAAFAENLNVYATATDGWGRLGYDNGDSMAFALTNQ